MPAPRLRPIHYCAITLHDGTVTAAFPIRKPRAKCDRRRPDADGVVAGFAESGSNLHDVNYEGRARFQDIMAANLNTRRAIRALVLPHLLELHDEMRILREQLDRVEKLLQRGSASATYSQGGSSNQC